MAVAMRTRHVVPTHSSSDARSSPSPVGTASLLRRKVQLALKTVDHIHGKRDLSARAAAVETQQRTAEKLSVSYLGLVEDKYTVTGQLLAAANADEVYSILTDYESSSRIFDNIASSDITVRDGRKILSQGCRWQFLVFGGEFKVDFTVNEQPEDYKLSFSLLESSFMKHFEGRWLVQQVAGGEGCMVQHQLAVMPFMALPPAVEAYVQKIFIKQVTDILEDLQEELQRRQQ